MSDPLTNAPAAVPSARPLMLDPDILAKWSDGTMPDRDRLILVMVQLQRDIYYLSQQISATSIAAAGGVPVTPVAARPVTTP